LNSELSFYAELVTTPHSLDPENDTFNVGIQTDVLQRGPGVVNLLSELPVSVLTNLGI